LYKTQGSEKMDNETYEKLLISKNKTAENQFQQYSKHVVQNLTELAENVENGVIYSTDSELMVSKLNRLYELKQKRDCAREVLSSYRTFVKKEL